MASEFERHFLLDTGSVLRFVRARTDFFPPDANLQAEEIGDGNINYVFRVRDTETGRSLVVKQADRLLRSSGRPLDTGRSRIEADILRIEGKLAPGCVPEVYDFCETMCAVTMEDVSDYRNLRLELLAGKTFPAFPEQIADFLARTLLPTTDLVLDRQQKKALVKRFTNPELCDITEDLVLTEPYWDYKNRNILTPGTEDFVRERLYENAPLKAEVAALRDRFMNCPQALLHGDLHTGSIFVNPDGIKVIDPEFAFYGPMGYDAGNVIGNLIFAWANKRLTEPQSAAFLKWIRQAVIAVFDGFRAALEREYDRRVTLPLYREDAFRQRYIDRIMADTVGYAGTELIRRTVGDAKVPEVTAVIDPETRRALDMLLIDTGAALILKRKKLHTGAAAANVFKQAAKQYEQ